MLTPGVLEPFLMPSTKISSASICPGPPSTHHLPHWFSTEKAEGREGLAELPTHGCFQNTLWLTSLKLRAAKHTC